MTGLEDQQKVDEALRIVRRLEKHHRQNRLETEYASYHSKGCIGGPYPWQLKFHHAGENKDQRAIIAANRVGKTRTVAAEVAIHLTGLYPRWWRGKRFDKPIRAWVAGQTNEETRNIIQSAILGDVKSATRSCDGTGWVPKHLIGKPAFRQCGISNVVDTIEIHHVPTGRHSLLTFKSYEQGWTKFQGFTGDIVWMDEEPDKQDDRENLFSEVMMRLLDSGGHLLFSRTPLFGYTPIVQHFLKGGPGIFYVQAGWDDAPHIEPERCKEMLERTPDHLKACRSTGTPKLGVGACIPLEESQMNEPAISIPDHWGRVAGLDFGVDHPTAVVWIAYDGEADTIHVYDCYKVSGEVPAVHSAAIKQRGAWIPLAWPHDGLQRDKGSGVPLKAQFEQHGLNMIPEPVSWESEYMQSHGCKAQSVEAGVLEMLERFRTGRLKIASHLHQWFEEARMWHRKTDAFGNSQIVPMNDDLMSATRYAIMSLRHCMTDRGSSERRVHIRADDYDPLASYSYGA